MNAVTGNKVKKPRGDNRRPTSIPEVEEIKVSTGANGDNGPCMGAGDESTSANQLPPAQCLHKLAQSHRSHKKVPTITEFGRVV